MNFPFPEIILDVFFRFFFEHFLTETLMLKIQIYLYIYIIKKHCETMGNSCVKNHMGAGEKKAIDITIKKLHQIVISKGLEINKLRQQIIILQTKNRDIIKKDEEHRKIRIKNEKLITELKQEYEKKESEYQEILLRLDQFSKQIVELKSTNSNKDLFIKNKEKSYDDLNKKYNDAIFEIEILKQELESYKDDEEPRRKFLGIF